MNYKFRHVVIIFTPILLILVCGANVYTLAQRPCAGDEIFTAVSCVGDTISDREVALLDIVNKYRAANGQPVLRSSSGLSILANRRALDLVQNLKSLTHSWSNCPYDIKDEKTWPCVIDAPSRLKTGYKGQGYETLYRTSTGQAVPTLALDDWSKSPLHNSIILNQGSFKSLRWNELGVAIDGPFAVLWFGYPGSGLAAAEENVIGLCVSFDTAVSGLSKILTIDQTSTTIENNTWTGLSADKKIKLEIHGTKKEIAEAEIGISIKLEPDRKLSPSSHNVLSTLLKNIFPEWADVEKWIETSADQIAVNPTVSKAKIVRKISIELRTNGRDQLIITVMPYSKPAYIEVF